MIYWAEEWCGVTCNKLLIDRPGSDLEPLRVHEEYGENE